MYSICIRFFLLSLLIFTLSPALYGQGFSIQSNKNPSVKDEIKDPFVSLAGRFKIDLPSMISSFGPVSLDAPKGKFTGDYFRWRMTEGDFEISYIDAPQGVNFPDVKPMVEQIRNQIIEKSNGKIISEKEIVLEGNKGYEFQVESSNMIVTVRFHRINNRVYQISAVIPSDKKVLLADVVKLLDTFKPLTTLQVEQEILKRVEAAMPKPLPQEPIAKKLKSDLEDDGLRGKVKMIIYETEYKDEASNATKKKLSSIRNYNENGNLTKTILYDYKGNPFDIAIYGYIDGDRVSDTKMIQYEYNPPPMRTLAPNGQPKPVYDPRYSYKYKYRYDDKGRLVEKWTYMSNGELWLRYVYNFKDNQKERLVYSANGKLNQKYVETLDNKGNVIEETFFEVKDDSVSNKYSYKYEFDSQGNWIKKFSSKQVTKDGKTFFEPTSVSYRTITYYQ